MTTHEVAGSMERIAVALRKLPDGAAYQGEHPALDGDAAVGAAVLWTYLRDLLTAAGKDIFTREELLVMLEVISRDSELFPPGVVELIANCQEGE